MLYSISRIRVFWSVLCTVDLFLLQYHYSEQALPPPHPHQGILSPLKLPHTEDILDDYVASSVLLQHSSSSTSEQENLTEEDRIIIMDEYDNHGNNDDKDSLHCGGYVFQDVHAPIHIVWDRIVDFNHYHEMIPNIYESEVYHDVIEATNDDVEAEFAYTTTPTTTQQQRVHVRVVLGFPFYKYQMYMKHSIISTNYTIRWTLDYDLYNDISDCIGTWELTSINENTTRIVYKIRISFFQPTPQFITDYTIQNSKKKKHALAEAVKWVKKYSEQAYNKESTPLLESTTAMSETTSTNAASSTTNINDIKTDQHALKDDTSTTNSDIEDFINPASATTIMSFAATSVSWCYQQLMFQLSLFTNSSSDIRIEIKNDGINDSMDSSVLCDDKNSSEQCLSPPSVHSMNVDTEVDSNKEVVVDKQKTIFYLALKRYALIVVILVLLWYNLYLCVSP